MISGFLVLPKSNYVHLTSSGFELLTSDQDKQFGLTLISCSYFVSLIFFDITLAEADLGFQFDRFNL